MATSGWHLDNEALDTLSGASTGGALEHSLRQHDRGHDWQEVGPLPVLARQLSLARLLPETLGTEVSIVDGRLSVLAAVNVNNNLAVLVLGKLVEDAWHLHRDTRTHNHVVHVGSHGAVQ